MFNLILLRWYIVYSLFISCYRLDGVLVSMFMSMLFLEGLNFHVMTMVLELWQGVTLGWYAKMFVNGN